MSTARRSPVRSTGRGCTPGFGRTISYKAARRPLVRACHRQGQPITNKRRSAIGKSSPRLRRHRQPVRRRLNLWAGPQPNRDSRRREPGAGDERESGVTAGVSPLRVSRQHTELTVALHSICSTCQSAALDKRAGAVEDEVGDIIERIVAHATP